MSTHPNRHLEGGTSSKEDPTLNEAASLLSQLPTKMLPVVERLHAIISQMAPDVRRSFVPVLKEEVQAILDGQNEFSIRIARLIMEDGNTGKRVGSSKKSANDDGTEQVAA